MLEPLLGVRDDHVTWTHPIAVAVLADVVLDAVLLVAAALTDRVQVVERHPSVREARARVAEATRALDLVSERRDLPALGKWTDPRVDELIREESTDVLGHGRRPPDGVEVHEPGLEQRSG